MVSAITDNPEYKRVHNALDEAIREFTAVVNEIGTDTLQQDRETVVVAGWTVQVLINGLKPGYDKPFNDVLHDGSDGLNEYTAVGMVNEAVGFWEDDPYDIASRYDDE